MKNSTVVDRPIIQTTTKKIVHTFFTFFVNVGFSLSQCLFCLTPTDPQYEYYANLLQVTSPAPPPPPPPLRTVKKTTNDNLSSSSLNLRTFLLTTNTLSATVNNTLLRSCCHRRFTFPSLLQLCATCFSLNQGGHSLALVFLLVQVKSLVVWDLTSCYLATIVHWHEQQHTSLCCSSSVVLLVLSHTHSCRIFSRVLTDYQDRAKARSVQDRAHRVVCR